MLYEVRRAAAGVMLVLTLALCAPATGQQQPQAPEPPRRDAEKVGPRTEPVEVEAYAQVLHVSPTGSDESDGSAANPFATIAHALSSIADATSEKRCAVFVAAGEYKGQALEMKPYVDLFGGFEGTSGGGSWQQRDIFAHPSIIDGEGARRPVVAAENARIDGFVIRNGKVRGPGGAILCDHVSPTISNNTIIENVTLEPEGFADKKMIHQVGHEGGGIACLNGSSPTITNNIIARNATEVGSGGGIGIANFSMPHIANNVIANNHAGTADITRSRSSNGGGISINNAQHRAPARLLIVNNVISENRVGGNSDGGGIYMEYDSAPLVAANWILGNLCEDDGGGMYIMKASEPDVVNNVFAGNKGHGAIVLSKGGNGNIVNNVMFANPGGVTCHDSTMTLTNNTIVGNRGSGVRFSGASETLTGTSVTGNIIYSNIGVQIEHGPKPLQTISNNSIQGGFPGQGNIDEPASFGNDRVTGQAKAFAYEPLRGTTTIAIGSIADGEPSPGRIFNVGDKWGVVKQYQDDSLIVWGDVRPANPENARFEISYSYQLRGSGPGGAGAK